MNAKPLDPEALVRAESTSDQPVRNPPQVPLLIGVAGHRDLVPAEVERLRGAVSRWFQALSSQFPDAPLEVASTLGPGAGLLVVEEALRAGIDCLAILPFPVEEYRADFTDPKELQRFEAAVVKCRQRVVYCAKVDVTEVERAAGELVAGTAAAGDPVAGTPVAGTPAAGMQRKDPYASAYEQIAADAFILLALWDGRPPEPSAMTAQIVEFRLKQRAWFAEEMRSAHQELLPNLPPDLVYHIVATRRGRGPARDLQPLHEGYRISLDGPLESSLPASARLVAMRTSELDRDLRRYVPRNAHDLVADLADAPASILDCAHLFTAIDSLASRLSRRVKAQLYLTAVFSASMGLLFLLYSHGGEKAPYPTSLYLFTGVFACLIGVNHLARSRQWHRRYLEARALAEGLRVELYWSLAGVGASNDAPAAHRRILKQSDPGLEWIPNAIRAASLSLCDVRRIGIPGGIEFASQRWIGMSGEAGLESGQLQYYRTTARTRAFHSELAERLALGSVVGGVLVTLLLVSQTVSVKFPHQHALLILMGIFPLLAGVIDTLVQKTAERELKRQYDYMCSVFSTARDRLAAATSDTERRRILNLLGHAALAEHAEWLFLHRDRPIDQNRMQ